MTKIDKVFLNESMDDKRGRDIIESIIHMAKKLDLTTVAEGVENIEQVKVLRTMGCDIAQGYYYAKPMSTNEFIKHIRGD
ncbi:MAG: EAL domain-containing protein [Cellulosilyticaceae bacterium]